MHQTLPTILLVSLLLSSWGCNRSASDQQPVATIDQESSQHPSASSSPDQVVEAFLVALRDGNDALAEALLTTKAREETRKHDLVVEPPGTPNAKFSIGDVEYLDPDKKTGAHVDCVWSEHDAGREISYEIVWALRQQPDGWRIAGMATEIISGQRPVFLNFEDPGDMLEKWQRAEEVAARYEDSIQPDGTLTR